MDINLVEMIEQFNSEDRCREYLELLRWPSGICCVRCGNVSVSKLQKRHQYECNGCRYQFSATAGTVFHDSHLPLWKWFLATYLICESKKGLSANQLKRTLDVSYKTAWYLSHRIREAMKCDTSERLKGIVEADETFIGGKYDKRRNREPMEKTCVVGVIQRGGPIRAGKIKSRGARALAAFIKESVEPGANLMTIENFWSLFKRGLVGSFHKVSDKHLDRYLDEFTYRFNGRDDDRLFQNTLKNLVNGKALTFEKLTA